MPHRFKAMLSERVRAIETQFGVTPSSADRGKVAERQYGSHAAWTLIAQVSEAAAPPHLGPLSTEAKACVKRMIDATIAYGNAVFEKERRRPSGARKNGDEPVHANPDHIKAVLQIQRGIWLLGEVLADLDREAFGLDDRSSCDATARHKARQLRQAILGLQEWRSELENRLSLGDYSKGARRKGELRLPRMPKLGRNTPTNERNRRIVAAAAPLIGRSA